MNKTVDTNTKMGQYNYMKTLKLILSYLPSKLPVGVTEFNAFADSIIELTGPFADPDSMKWAIANNIIHLPATTSHKAKQYFVRSLRKAAANQVASFIFQDIKLKQQERAAQEAAAAAKVDTDVKILPV